MQQLMVFFLNSAAREQFLLGKLVRKLHKAANHCYKAYVLMMYINNVWIDYLNIT